jgi:hypothetical protein
MAQIDTSFYPTQPQPSNLLGMASQFATTQNALNTNALFQQTFRARQAMGPLAQQSIGPDGQMDYNKFAVLLSAHPDTAFMAPDIINGMVQRQLTQQETVGKSLANAQSRADALGRYAGAAVAKHPDGAIPQNEVMGVAALVHALHLDAGGEPGAAISWATTIGKPTAKDGTPQLDAPYDPKLAHQQLSKFQIAQETAAQTLDRTTKTYNQNFGGGAQVGVENALTGTRTPMSGPGLQPGGIVPQTSGPGTTTIDQSGKTTQSLVGQPLPPVGGMVGAPRESILGSGAATSRAPYTGGPAGPQATTSLGPVTTGQLAAMPKYIASANQSATDSTNLNRIMDELDKARSGFKTGGGMDTFIAAAKLAQGLGFSTPIVDKVAQGNLGDASVYAKLQPQLAASILMASVNKPGVGRIPLIEYQTFNKNNANWDTDPRGIDKMFTFMRNQNSINLARSQLVTEAARRASDPEYQGKELLPGLKRLVDFEPWFNKEIAKRPLVSKETAKVLSTGSAEPPAGGAP